MVGKKGNLSGGKDAHATPEVLERPEFLAKKLGLRIGGDRAADRARKDFEKGGFSRAIGTEESDLFSRTDLKSEVFKNLLLPTPNIDVFEVEGGSGHGDNCDFLVQDAMEMHRFLARFPRKSLIFGLLHNWY